MPRKPVEQEYESKHQNLLAQQERRLQGAWSLMEECRGCLPGHWLGGVFPLLAHCEHKELFLLRPGEEPPEDRNGAVFSIVVMVLSMASLASLFRILAR